MTEMQNSPSDRQIKDFQKLAESPSASKRTQPSVNDYKFPWRESPRAHIAPAITPPSCGHVTRIAISNNASQLHTPASPSRELLRNNISTNTNSLKSNISGSICGVENSAAVLKSSTSRHPSQIPRISPEITSTAKSSASSISASLLRQISPSPSKVCSPSSLPMVTTFSVYQENPLPASNITSVNEIVDNSTVINGSTQQTITTVANASATAAGHSYSSTTNNHPIPVSTKFSSVIPSTCSSASSTVIEGNTFSLNDNGRIEETNYSMKDTNEKGIKRMEEHSRIPRIRSVKATTAMKKSHLPCTSNTTDLADATTTESCKVSHDNKVAFRSRLPVRSSRSSGLSTSGTAEKHSSRISSSDEKLLQSRIPVMASSMHRAHPQTHFTGQMIVPTETSNMQITSSSTNSRVITDL
ncbi:unnamed protein product [Thelazia callipaeda]|uniref:Flocculation protein FLO11-like n=1 Tax=Thelazia callipaeda TaxID=103827 RepID=A0A0N5D0A4_THECL|nr:unnamed protein product [Thelazia callipaeda]